MRSLWLRAPSVLITWSVALVACSSEPDGAPQSAGASGAPTQMGRGGAASGSAGAPPMGGVVGGSSASAGAAGDRAGSSGQGSGQAGSAGAPGIAGAAAGGVAGEVSAGSGGAPVVGTAGKDAGGSGGTNSAGKGGASAASGSGGAAPTAGAGGTAGKVVLFDGTNLDAFQQQNGGAARWRLVDDAKAMEVVPGTGNIVTKEKFGSMFLHVEYSTPALPSNVTGQSRGNSGIYIKRAYEFQVLDSAGLPPADDTCGAIYKTRAPLVSACLGAEMWNTYEIEFRDSVWTQGTKTEPALVVSARLNGELVHENVRLTIDPTQAGIADAAGPQPLLLQDHDPQGRVRYRNIWLIPR